MAMSQTTLKLDSNTIPIEGPIALRFLGPMAASWKGCSFHMPRSKRAKAVIAVLAMADGVPVPKPILIKLLWATRGHRQAQASLRHCIYEIRQSFKSYPNAFLRSNNAAVSFCKGIFRVDVIALQEVSLEITEFDSILPGIFLPELMGVTKELDLWISSEQSKLVTNVRKRIRKLIAFGIEPQARNNIIQILKCFTELSFPVIRTSYKQAYNFEWAYGGCAMSNWFAPIRPQASQVSQSLVTIRVPAPAQLFPSMERIKSPTSGLRGCLQKRSYPPSVENGLLDLQPRGGNCAESNQPERILDSQTHHVQVDGNEGVNVMGAQNSTYLAEFLLASISPDRQYFLFRFILHNRRLMSLALPIKDAFNLWNMSAALLEQAELN